MKKLKVFLCGYHWVGCRVLEHLLERDDVSDVGVFTHEPSLPDHDLANLTTERGTWHTLESVNDAANWPFQPDIITSIYYRKIVKPNVIEQVNGRIFNLHPSLLPRHRGCSSLTWAIFEGDPIAGFTFHFIDAGVDTGKILLQAAVQIGPQETQGSLYQRVMEAGAAFWPAAFELVKAGFTGVPQQGEATMHRRGAPHDGKINDAWPMDKIGRFIRAMTNPPYPYATYCDQEVKTLGDYLRLRDATQ